MIPVITYAELANGIWILKFEYFFDHNSYFSDTLNWLEAGNNMTMLKSLPSDTLSIVYDGNCPYCNSFVKLVRLRESIGEVDLIDGRIRTDVVEELRELGFDIDQGMAVLYRNHIYYAGDAMNILANLSTNSGFWNRIISLSLRHRFLSSIFYPLFRGIRNMTLRILGRKPIIDGQN